MRLTLHTDYALRVLIYVAVADGKLITINQIAKSFDISKQHLMKVVNDLSLKGYLDTVRGRGDAEIGNAKVTDPFPQYFLGLMAQVLIPALYGLN